MSDCCSPSPTTAVTPATTPAPMACFRCGQPGKVVSLLTLKHQVKPDHLTAVEAGPFAFCRSPECPVVYFNATGTTLWLDDVRQRPTVKKSGNPRLCYCFGFDTEMARAEIQATGRCTIPDRIAAEMKTDRCACEIRNPQGSCCFANVTAAVKREMSATEIPGNLYRSS
ncbi:MAG: copper chaperone Copz family protein [Opitutae bacterium]|nr:copper chaperone Copz family protein [Opitutae bacterium]